MDKIPILGQLLTFWRGLSLGRQLALAIFTFGALGAALYISFIGSHENFGVLYADLSTEDAAAISQKLKERKIEHHVLGSGNAIEVPESQVPSLRLELASDGLPRGGGAGFELFDKPRIGATEFEQQINLKRALEGELARSINTIDGVKAARVHLVLPERRLFLASEQQASASVVLKLSNPSAFSKQEVAATVHLVATAVPGLSRDRVSVVSTDGVTLHRPTSGTGDEGGGGDDQRQEKEQEAATRLEDHVRSLLERVVGVGNAEVRMSVALDPSVTERTLERYEPAKTALRSEYLTEERTGGDAASVAGVPGAQSNLGDKGGEVTTTTVDKSGNVLRTSHQRNWEIDRVLEKTKIPSGQIQRVSMAVLVNKKANQNINKDMLASLGQMAKQSIGFSEQRGDAFSIDSIDFAKVDIADVAEEPVPVWKKAINYVPMALGALVALVLLIVILKSQKSRQTDEQTYARLNAAKQVATQELQGTREQILNLPSASNANNPAQLGDGAPRKEEVRSRALELASQDPATAAVILRSWLNSGASPEPITGES
ncbi:MAG: flagellar basal-body MS-ring/collar protein FliF [Polyangiaceae bacterium]|nr:flagellar basal-body MS-ring/collar protein FliF [Polyangiaceae bacterium]